jgi:hypothetical protein
MVLNARDSKGQSLTLWLGPPLQPHVATSANPRSQVAGFDPFPPGWFYPTADTVRKRPLLPDPDDYRPVLSRMPSALGRLFADRPKGCRLPRRARGNAGFADGDHRGQRLGVLQPGDGRLVIPQRSED